jgi:hypothetical protein
MKKENVRVTRVGYEQVTPLGFRVTWLSSRGKLALHIEDGVFSP